VSPAPRETRAAQDLREDKVCRDHVVRMDNQELQGLTDNREPREWTECREKKVYGEKLACLVLQDSPGLEVLQVWQAAPAPAA